MILVYKWPTPEAKERIKAKAFWDEGFRSKVEQIIADVQARGDEALLAYNQLFDGCLLKEAEELRVSAEEIAQAYDLVE